MAGNGSGATTSTRSRAHLTNKKPVLAKVDRSGSPTDLVTFSGAAEICGYSSYRNLLHELIEPRRHQELPSGRIHRHWYPHNCLRRWARWECRCQ